MSASDSKQTGFTMIEMMVVIAIIGIVATLSLKSFKSDEAGTDARHVASQMATARRFATQGGAVRPDVVAALQPPNPQPPVWPASGSAPDPTKFPFARARLEITLAAGVQLVRVWKLDELVPLGTFQWTYVTGTYLSDETSVAGVDRTAALTPTGAAPAAPAWPVYIYYYPDGSADAVTTFLENKDGKGKRYRIVGLPLVPAPQVFIDW
jgi:prepilin-type N-terminal cleavage/methylation domain-containing protein